MIADKRDWAQALYIHIPFCASRCAYCDFCTEAIAANDQRIDDYVEDLVAKIFKLGRSGAFSNVETIYIGGGTPTHIGSKRLSSLLYALGLSMNLTDNIEVTVECNPESFDDRLAKDIFALGVNRLSFGVQTFKDEILETLGRPHTSDDARRAIEAAKERFDNISLDLIAAVPGQALASFEGDLKEALTLEPSHVSVYGLTIEPGTRLEGLVDSGKLLLPSEDEAADMLALANDVMTSAGFEHYEVSNFAKPGYRCAHNMAYWKGKPYLGLGRGAVSMMQDSHSRIRERDGEVIDEISASQARCEDAILAMRTSDGLPLETVARMDEEGYAGILEKFEGFVESGLVSKKDGRFVPTDTGFLLGNEIYIGILDFFN